MGHVSLLEGDDGRIHIDGNAVRSSLIEGLARGIAQLRRESGLGVPGEWHPIGSDKGDIPCRLMDIVLNVQSHGEMIVPLVAVLQSGGAQVLNPHVLVPFQGEEDVVLVGI